MRRPAQIPNDNFRWRWPYFVRGRRILLHRVSAPFPIPDPETDQFYTGVPAIMCCGREGKVVMPGILSRLRAPRCRHCCRRAGVPYGFGNPYNEGLEQ